MFSRYVENTQGPPVIYTVYICMIFEIKPRLVDRFVSLPKSVHHVYRSLLLWFVSILSTEIDFSAFVDIRSGSDDATRFTSSIERSRVE